MYNIELYPWLVDDYKKLIKLTANNKVQAMLIYGQVGIGVDNLVDYWCRFLFCDNPIDNNLPCNRCNSCVLYTNGTHPDYFKLVPLENEKNISVNSIRNMIEFISLSTHCSKYKIVQIDNSDLLNKNSSNALLKILEMPPNYAIFIIKSNNIKKILPTILSRCNKINLKRPDKNIAYNFLKNRDIKNVDFWLDYSCNSPLYEIMIDNDTLDQFVKVLTTPTIDSIYKFLELLNNMNVKYSFCLDFINKWITDLVCYKLTKKLTYFNTYITEILNLTNSLNTDNLFNLHEKLLLLIEYENHTLNTNLQLENIFFQYYKIVISK